MKGGCLLKDIVKNEIIRLDKMLKKIDSFLSVAPEGCLKWQNKKGKTYYYHQLQKDDGKWGRKYIKKEKTELARKLATKHYYSLVKSIVEKQLEELRRFQVRYPDKRIEDVYASLSPERKNLITPLAVSVKEKIKEWQEEVYEQASMHPENLRYETEQGEMVRSKSELIIANILYRNREHLLYKYERPLEVFAEGKKKTIYPDFTILNIHTGEIKYWEHAGRMDDSHYASEFVKKINIYEANELLPGRDVILTFETQGCPLDVKNMRKVVEGLIIEK